MRNSMSPHGHVEFAASLPQDQDGINAIRQAYQSLLAPVELQQLVDLASALGMSVGEEASVRVVWRRWTKGQQVLVGR